MWTLDNLIPYPIWVETASPPQPLAYAVSFQASGIESATLAPIMSDPAAVGTLEAKLGIH